MELSKLTNEEQELLERDLSVQEIKNVLHSFEKNKTPGEDGFTKEFYETFFVSQRRGVISLITKGDSDLSELSAWRSITLLNVDYKILAKTIAKRIEPFLPKLIHSDQTGFVKDRYIGQNIRLLSDLMEYTDVKKISGILLFIDFEKAFYFVEWKIIMNSLELFNFGPSIRNGSLFFIITLRQQ